MEKKTDLKRFSGFSYRTKLQSNVEFPLSLDLAEFSSDPESELSLLSSLEQMTTFQQISQKLMYLCKHSKVPRGKELLKKNCESQLYLVQKFRKLSVIFLFLF